MFWDESDGGGGDAFVGDVYEKHKEFKNEIKKIPYYLGYQLLPI